MPRHYFGFFLLLLCLWLMLSGEYSLYHPLVSISGLLSCLFVTWLAWRMDIRNHAWSPLHLHYPRWLAYTLWLCKEVALANLHVSRLILASLLGKQNAIRPAMRDFATSQRGNAARVIYANSITLTPGTVAVQVNKHSLTVHALSETLLEGYADGLLDARVTQLEMPRSQAESR